MAVAPTGPGHAGCERHTAEPEATAGVGRLTAELALGPPIPAVRVAVLVALWQSGQRVGWAPAYAGVAGAGGHGATDAGADAGRAAEAGEPAECQHRTGARRRHASGQRCPQGQGQGGGGGGGIRDAPR